MHCPIIPEETKEPEFESATNVAIAKHMPDVPCKASFASFKDRTTSDTVLAKIGSKKPHEESGP